MELALSCLEKQRRAATCAFMNTTHSQAPHADPAVMHTLVALLERLDRSSVPVGADQYRSVVLHLVDQFDQTPSDAGLRALLDSHPAAAELYENLNYRHAGLCRSPLDAALAAEVSARQVIARAMRATGGTAERSPDEQA